MEAAGLCETLIPSVIAQKTAISYKHCYTEYDGSKHVTLKLRAVEFEAI
jgi:hypothetical protein